MGSTSAMFEHPGAGSSTGTDEPPPNEKSRLQKVKDEVRMLFGRPSTGRTTVLGRKVEKPGDASAAGPSGQREVTQHNRKHTNK